MSDSNADYGAFVAGFLIGGLVGAATALLMAPQSGEETRAYIRDRSIELRDKAYETADQARAMMKPKRLWKMLGSGPMRPFRKPACEQRN